MLSQVEPSALRTGLLVLALGLAGCTPIRECQGDCECSADDDCMIGCPPDAEGWACDCTNGHPVAVKGHEGEDGCGEFMCMNALCGAWTQYEARCSFGRCVGVPVGELP